MNTTKPNFVKFEVSIFGFSHDVNGNPNALHACKGFKNYDDTHGVTLYEASRRAQVGYANRRDEQAPSILANVGAVGFKCVESYGSRSENCITLVYVDDVTKYHAAILAPDVAEKCAECNGSGFIVKHGSDMVCPDCNGRGVI